MTLDDRGRRAARNLTEEVKDAPLLLMERGVPAARVRVQQSRLLSFAGAFAAVVLLVGLTLVQVDLFSPQRETSTTSDTFPVNTVTTGTTSTTEAPPTTTRDTVPTAVPHSTPDTVPVDDIAPALSITFPENGATVGEKSLRFAGTTEPGALVAAGPYLADVSEDGQWSIVLLLNPGGNLASFTSTDAAGNTTEASVSVIYQVPAPPKEEPPSVTFTAFQKWGSCAESPPFDEFFGMAKPGTKVFVTSSFGSASTTAAGNGEWYVKVFFEAAPYGEAFEVKARDDFGNKAIFEFTSLVAK
jgi:cytoskeletal protein RodZ